MQLPPGRDHLNKEQENRASAYLHQRESGPNPESYGLPIRIRTPDPDDF